MKSPLNDSDPADDQEWLELVRQKVSKLRFGSVQITVHDGRVTQVETVEKTRFVPRARDEKELKP